VSSLNHPVSASESPPSEGAAAIAAIEASLFPPPCRPRAACLPPRARARSELPAARRELRVLYDLR
jgi:hypothetical protein